MSTLAIGLDHNSRSNIRLLMSDRRRRHKPYTWQGQFNLGQVIKRGRSRLKPDWEPVRGNLSDEEYQQLVDLERNKPWSLREFAQILNREYGLTGDSAYNFQNVRSLEDPPRQRAEPPRQLIRDILDLQICINRQTGKPFTEAEFDLICQESMTVDGVVIDNYLAYDSQ